MDLAKIQAAQKAAVGHQLVVLDHYFVHNNPGGNVSINDFPIVPVGDIHDKTQSFTHAFDIIRDVGDLSMEATLQIISDGKELPPPFSFKNPLGKVDIQCILTNESDGTHNFLLSMSSSASTNHGCWHQKSWRQPSARSTVST